MTDDQNQAFAGSRVRSPWERSGTARDASPTASACTPVLVPSSVSRSKRDRVTVIPVAQIDHRHRCRRRQSGAEAETGAGAGGGALTRPLGYIEVTDAGADFRPIQQPWQDAGLVVSAAFAVLLLAKAVRTLVRG